MLRVPDALSVQLDTTGDGAPVTAEAKRGTHPARHRPHNPPAQRMTRRVARLLRPSGSSQAQRDDSTFEHSSSAVEGPTRQRLSDLLATVGCGDPASRQRRVEEIVRVLQRAEASIAVLLEPRKKQSVQFIAAAVDLDRARSELDWRLERLLGRVSPELRQRVIEAATRLDELLTSRALPRLAQYPGGPIEPRQRGRSEPRSPIDDLVHSTYAAAYKTLVDGRLRALAKAG